ncbi:bifunctional lysylphosphatidylglycerol flippase/synthetase MprF [Austwickia sp. TVS 96-490-7B]|uniref:bifunctional lysylphosphatidylglycerol flippase/synthetase MprF n=1 Tax=Austwickia sp. TVS 96-490-7B TaxID=2830843 RepID=UPI001C55DDE8|nr:DUF2156 domain-containing protein [Austwickia sp. TVS 96-490-7B]
MVILSVVIRYLPMEIQDAVDEQWLLHLGLLTERPWTLFTSYFVPGSPLTPWLHRGWVSGLVLVLLVGAPTERLLGRTRFLAVMGVSQVLGALLSLGFAQVIVNAFGDWSDNILTYGIAGPAPAIAGAGAAATSYMSRLWRRRWRVTGGTAVATMALFHGGALSVSILCAGVAGLLIGMLLRPRRADVRPVGSIHEARVLVALILAAGAIGPLLGAWLGVGDGPLSILASFIAKPAPEAAELLAHGCHELSPRDCAIQRLTLAPDPGLLLLTCVPTVLLLIFSVGLRRGRRLAWIGALAIELILAGFLVDTMLEWIEDASSITSAPISTEDLLFVLLPTAEPICLALLLIATRGLFTVAGPPGSVRRLLSWSAAIVGVGLAVYVLVGLAVLDQWTPRASLGQLVADAPRRLVPLEYLRQVSDAFPTLLPAGPVAMLLYSWIGVATWIPLTIVLARAQSRTAGVRPEADRARDLLIRHGGGSLAWMGLWAGNAHWFSADGESYVPYRVIGSVALTTGDLVGPADRAEQALSEFLAHADSQGWTVAFYSAGEQMRTLTAARGWESVQVAEEAVLSLPDLAFTGKRFQDVRTALNHVRKQNLTTSWTTWQDAPLEIRLQIREISEQWVSEQALPEMGFTLGGLDELADPAVRLFLLTDADGVLQGCASWLPIYRDGQIHGWTLDFMRRPHHGFRHTMEVLIGQAALDLQAEGCQELSLSGAPLAKVPPADGVGTSRPGVLPAAVDAMLELVGRELEPVYGFRSLLRFKAKFQPSYRPMYLLYADPAVLPAIARAVTRAYVPDASFGLAWRVVEQMRKNRAPAPKPVVKEDIPAPASSSGAAAAPAERPPVQHP